MAELFVPANPAEIRQDMIEDIYLETAKFGTPQAVSPGSDAWVWATAGANAQYLNYGNIALLSPALTPLNATGQDLDDWRESLGLPEVDESIATGKIVVEVTGSATIPDGTEFTLSNRLRGKVVGNWVGVTDGTEVDVETIDGGTQANTAGGAKVRFVSPPTNVATEAEVSQAQPLQGGTDEEDDARKRERILNRLRNAPGSGNWGQLREWAFEALGIVSNAYVYPALGGPSSVKVVPVRRFDLPEDSYTHELSTAAIEVVRRYIQARVPGEVEVIVQSVADESVDLALQLTLPASVNAGGTGNGWLDATPWPDLDGDTRVSVSSVTNSKTIVLGALTSTAPTANSTRIGWWSRNDRRFRVYTVASQSGSSGAWTITLDRPLVDNTGQSVQAGDFISPAAENMVAYGQSWVAIMDAMAPGENTAQAGRVPRALRHPKASDLPSESLTILQLRDLLNQYNEITDAQYSYRSVSTPTVPASVATAPNILVPRNLGIYEL